jgi:hypothetical protein
MASTTTDLPVTSEHKVRPTKPDEEAYKAELAKAEKEHAAVQEKLVRKIHSHQNPRTSFICRLAILTS